MHPLFHPLFIDYCAYFNGNQDYFECHEVLEEYWKEIAPGERQHPLVGYVQLATGMYHWRRANHAGASRILAKAVKNFEANEHSPYFDYICFDSLLQSTKTAAAQASDQPFQTFQLTIKHIDLSEAVEKVIAALPAVDANYLLHKHMLRDRSDILLERAAKIASKAQK